MFNMSIQPEKIIDFTVENDMTCYRIRWYDSWVLNDSFPTEWQHLVEQFWKKTTDQQHQVVSPETVEDSIIQKDDNLLLTKLPNFSSLISGSSDVQSNFLSQSAVNSLSVLQPELEQSQQPLFQQQHQQLSSFVTASQQNSLDLPSSLPVENQIIQSNELTNVTSNFQLSLFGPTTQNEFQIMPKELVTASLQDDSTLSFSSNDLNPSSQMTSSTESNNPSSSKIVRKIVRKIPSNPNATESNNNGNDITCNECNRNFSKTLNPKKRLREHVRRVHLKNGKFQCTNCPKSFVCRQGLRDHEPVHSKERNHACTYCGQTFLRLSHLYIHTRTHEEEKNFRCEACFFTFNVQSELKGHCENNHSDISIDIKCSVCKQNLFSSQSIYSHSLRHSGTRNWKCDVCGAAFKRKQILDQHKKRHMDDPNQRKKFPCGQCSKEFLTSSALCEHQFLDHQSSSDIETTNGNKCEVCGKVFKNWANYNRHVSLHPKLQEMASIAKEQENELDQETNTINQEVSCKACLEKFNNIIHLLSHLREHQQNTNNAKKLNSNTFCNVCNRSFTCTGYLKKHMEMHGTTELKCDVCFMIFKRRDTLRIHKKRHLQRNETVENFKGMKGEISNQRKALYANIGEPDENGKVPCPYCVKKFNKRKLLLAHIVIHSDVFFKCEVCGKSYKQRNCLNKHKQSHLAGADSPKKNKRPPTVKPRTKGKYKCTVCSQGFNSIKVLSEHEVSHKTFGINCKDCDLAFLSKDDFELHIRQTHTNKNRRNSLKADDSCI